MYTRSKGFTIVELMIATAVFSTILLVVLTAITQIGRMYYKGITTARTQEAARTISERLSREIQYTGQGNVPISGSGSSTPTNKVICIGNTRFFYVLNKIARSNTRALWVDTNTGCTSANIQAVADSAGMSSSQPTLAAYGGVEMLPEGSRIVDFSASSAGNNLYVVKVKVVFGEDELVEASDGSALTSANAATAVCKGSAIGTQFCATSELSTAVLKRTP